MQDSTRTQIQTCFAASARGLIHFGEVIARLKEAGVASYHADYLAGRITCYLPDDETLDLALVLPDKPVAQTFDANGIVAAIREAQAGRVMYPQFQQLSQQAGCVAYTVWLAGRHVVYHGRAGQTHVERFPGD